MSLPTTTDLQTLILPNAEPIQHFKTANMFADEYELLPAELKDAYDYDPYSRTFSLRTTEWLNWRKHGPYHYDPYDARYIDVTLGGSDMGTLFCGSELEEKIFLYPEQKGSSYKAAIELYYEKIGQELSVKEWNSNLDVLYVGHAEEESIRSMFKKLYTSDHPMDIVEVINDTHMYQCGQRDTMGKLLYPFAIVNLDAMVSINGIEGILECKTCTKSSEDYILWKNGKVPLKYYLQCCWYMMTMNKPYAYICVKWGMLPSEYRYFYIERNFEIEALLLRTAKRFIDGVKTNTPPALDGQDVNRLNIFYRKLYGEEIKAETVQLPDDVADDIMELSLINDDISSCTAKINKLKTERNTILCRSVFPYLKNAQKGQVKLTSKASLEISVREKKKHVNLERLRDEAPDIYKRYLVTKETFNESLFAKEQTALMEQFGEEKIDVLTDAMQNYCRVRMCKQKS